MNNYNESSKISSCKLRANETKRYLNPNAIDIEYGYKIEVFAEGFDAPSSILFTDDGTLLVATSGYTTGYAYILQLVNGNFELFAENFEVPLTGINYKYGNLYVSHKGKITVIKKDGTRQDIISGLPSYGDYSNSRVTFGTDNKIYFGLGTATNSGVVGLDNLWVTDYPFFHDYPADYIMLYGQNFETNDLLSPTQNIVLTGAFSPYSVPNQPYEIKKGILKASGSILRANLDGSQLEVVASGLRSPSYIKFDGSNRLFVSNNGYDVRGSRPIANAADEFQLITPGSWYGFPDYSGGEPITSPRFKPDGAPQPEFLLTSHPGIPPNPFALFPPDSTIIGFDFNQNSSFGTIGDVYIAEFGSVQLSTIGEIVPQYPGIGYKISKINMFTRAVTTFAMNKSGFTTTFTDEGGFGRPADIAFGPDGFMYILDSGINTKVNSNVFVPNSGVIWKASRIY